MAEFYIYIYIDIYIYHSLHAERDTVTQGHQTKPKTQKTIKLLDRFWICCRPLANVSNTSISQLHSPFISFSFIFWVCLHFAERERERDREESSLWVLEIKRWLHHQQRLVPITITSSSFYLLVTVVSLLFLFWDRNFEIFFIFFFIFNLFVLIDFKFWYGCITACDLVCQQMGIWSHFLFDWF